MIYDTCYIIVDVCIVKELHVLKQVYEIHCICDNLHTVHVFDAVAMQHVCMHCVQVRCQLTSCCLHIMQTHML